MPFNELTFSHDVIDKLVLIDHDEKEIRGNDLNQENLILTREGKQIIQLSPISNGAVNPETTSYAILSLKDEKEEKTEIHRVDSLKELAKVLTENFGVPMLYRHYDTDYCTLKGIKVKTTLDNGCNVCPYCGSLHRHKPT